MKPTSVRSRELTNRRVFTIIFFFLLSNGVWPSPENKLQWLEEMKKRECVENCHGALDFRLMCRQKVEPEREGQKRRQASRRSKEQTKLVSLAVAFSSVVVTLPFLRQCWHDLPADNDK